MGEGAVTFYLKEPEVQDVMWQTYLFQIVPVVVWHSYWDAIPGDFHPIIHVAICRSGNGYDLIGWNMMKIYSLIFDKKRNSPISKFNRNKSALSERKKNHSKRTRILHKAWFKILIYEYVTAIYILFNYLKTWKKN